MGPFSSHIHHRIAFSYILLIGIVLLGLGGVLVPYLRSQGYAALESELHRQALLVADHAQLLLALEGPGELDRLAKRLAADGGVRTTLIDAGGKVLGDSDHDPATMDNHANRPEVARALGGSSGQSQRYSTTLDRDLLYVAVPIRSGDTVVGVARVALPTAEVERSIGSVLAAVVVALAVASLFSVLLAAILARITTRRLQQLTIAVDRLAAGSPSGSIPVRGSDEVAVLATAFNQMAHALGEEMHALERQRERLAAILRDMADGVIMTDADGTVLLVNPAADRILSLGSRAEGKSLPEAVRDYELIQLAREAAAEPSKAHSRVVEIGGPSGRRVIQAIATALRDAEARRSGALLILQDVTDLRRADVVRREFVANVSHELRTPVTAIKALVETLEDGAIADPAAAKDFLGRMHVEVDGLAQLIEELLELSRIESGRVAMDRRDVEVSAVVRAVVERLGPLAERQGVTLVNPDGSAGTVRADADRIQQVLVNLVHNAIKFTPPGGRVTVTVAEGPREVVVLVADTGAGIAPENLPRLFERFYKSDRSRAGGGTGLGLAIAKHIVEAHGGRIWVDSPGEGRGATFGFALPSIAK
jgi:two-component system phosphate regulon sensor histidine kinase PhoR